MDEVNETLEFLRFAIRPDATYTGVVVFVLRGADQVEHVRAVHVRDGVVTIDGSAGAAAASPSCVVRCAQDTFLGVYSGDLHPRTAILGGRLHVDGFNYGELRSFLSSFDFSSAKWRDFYRVRDAGGGGVDGAAALLSSWRSMLVPTALAQSASRSLHLSRRVLTQNLISEVTAAGSTGAVLAPLPPVASTVPLPGRSEARRAGAVVRILQTLIRQPVLVTAREHADFLHRLL